MVVYGLIVVSLVVLLLAAWLVAFAMDPAAFQNGARR